METISNAKVPRISSSVLRQLTDLKTYKSLMAILFEWFIIAVAILAHIKFPNPLLYLAVYLIIATRLYALYSLIHEAIHHLIVKNNRLNDIISQVFLGNPLFINLKKMRAIHFAHHKYLFSDKDPEMKLMAYDEFSFPKNKWAVTKVILLDLTGINFMKYKLLKLKSLVKEGNFFDAITDHILTASMITTIIIVGFYFSFLEEVFFYWILPYTTLYQLLNRLRLSTEHFNIDEQKTIKTRSVIPNLFQKLTIIPYNLGYHTEHHLYPGVPFYNLPKLQEVLLKDETYSANATIEHGFFSISKQYIK